MANVIESISAFVAIDVDGDEGVAAFRGPDGSWMPMVCADQKRVDSLRPIARSIANVTVLEVIEPSTKG